MKRFVKIALAAAFLIFSTVFSCLASSESPIPYTLSEYEELPSNDLQVLYSTGTFNWALPDGTPPERLTHNRLGGYLLISDGENGRAVYTSQPSEALDFYDYGRMYFAVNVTGLETERFTGFEFELKLSSYDSEFVYSGRLSADKWNVISFDVGFLNFRKEITKITFSLTDGTGRLGSCRISGPYVSASDKLHIGNLMSPILSSTETELEYTGRGSANETAEVRLGGQRISVGGEAAVAYGKSACNALRLVLTNKSELDSMTFRYTYFDTGLGKYISESCAVELKAWSSHFSYLVDLGGSAGQLSSFSLVFDGAGEGAVLIEKIEPVYVYPEKNRASYGTISVCRLNSKKSSVTIEGTVNHNFLIMHDDYTLACFALWPLEDIGHTESDGVLPLSIKPMSSDFSFTIDVSKLGAFPSCIRYAVCAVSPDGELILLASPRYPDADCGVPETSSGRTNIKGIETNTASDAAGVGAGYAIVDLWLDRLVNSGNSGILCAAGDEYICFDASYLEEIDGKIKNLSADGCKVYIRLLISPDADSDAIPYADAEGKSDASLCLAVAVRSERARTHFCATVSFICSRYSSIKNGKISGLVLGRALDVPTRSFAASSFGMLEYSMQVAGAMELMAHSASAVIPGIEIFLSLSDGRWESADSLDSEIFLTSVCRIFEESGGLAFSVILEGTHTPYGLSADMFDNEVIILDEEGNLIGTEKKENTKAVTPADEESGWYGTDNLYVFERMLDYLSGLSDSAPGTYIYCWYPDYEKIGNGLSAAYVYNYYKIMFSDRAGALVLSLPEDESASAVLKKLAYLMKYIDTERNSGGELCEAALYAFGADSWQELIDGYDVSMLVHRTYYEAFSLESLPKTVKGSYTAWDFSTAFGTLDWFAGNHCLSVSASSVAPGGKSFHAVLSEAAYESYGYADVVYRYEYPEDIRFLSCISLDLSVGDENDGSLYEIMVVFCGESYRIECKSLVQGGEASLVIADLSEYEEIDGMNSIRICVRRISGEAAEDGKLDLYLRKIGFHSDRYDSEALETAILAARAKAQNIVSAPSEAEEKTNTELIAVVILVLAVAVGMTAFSGRKHRE